MAGKGWPYDVCGQSTPAKEAANRTGGVELEHGVRDQSMLTSPARFQDPGHSSKEEKTISRQL